MDKEMRKIFVCSPLRGNIKSNQKKTREYCKEVVKQGFLPIAPHIYFTQFLDELKIEERNHGIKCGIDLLEMCKEIWVYGDTISEGMQKEIDYAKKRGIIIKWKQTK